MITFQQEHFPHVGVFNYDDNATFNLNDCIMMLGFIIFIFIIILIFFIVLKNTIFYLQVK